MFAIVGIVIVFGAVIGGFLMEKGHLAVLVQPAEFLILVGAAVGTLLVANPIHILKGVAAGVAGVLKGSRFNKDRYLSTLKMMYQFLNKVRKEGLLSVEMDVEKPEESTIFMNYPEFLGDHHARDFVCDTLRTAITGGVEPFDMDQMMELDMEVHHHAQMQPVSALSTVADALPGLASWPRCWAWSLPWARSAALPRRSAKKWPRRWWARSLAFCCATAWPDLWPRT
jgi:chemotaxis protein MotA